MPLIILILIGLAIYFARKRELDAKGKTIKIKPSPIEKIKEKTKNMKGSINMKFDKKTIIILVIAFAVLIVLFASIKTVPTGSVGVKTRFGAVQKTMINEGINFKAPFIER